MQAIEFVSKAHDGVVDLPSEYQGWNGKNVRVILLDEPAGGINPTMINYLLERIRTLNKAGVTFLVVEHNMEFVMSLCSRVMVMAEGKVLAMGRPDEVRANPAVIEAYLGH